MVVTAAAVIIRKESVDEVLSLRFLERPQAGEWAFTGAFDLTESWDVAGYLQSNTTVKDRIQVWGYEPLVYYLSERRPASRFYATYPLVIRRPGTDLTPMQLRWREEFMRDLKKNTPAYIAVVRDDDWWWSPERMTSQQLLNDFPDWKSFIHDHYVLEHEIGRIMIFRHEKRSPGSAPSAGGYTRKSL